MADTDYTPGDQPVPVGATVDYFGSHCHGRYEITGHDEPDMLGRSGDVNEIFPDGVSYDLWPSGVSRKFGNRDRSILNVRRTLFRVVALPNETKE